MPIFDLDILNRTAPDKEDAHEALKLYVGIVAHPQASVELVGTLIATADFVRAYGSAEDINAIESHEAARLASQ